MSSIAVRLLALVAVLLLPFAMASAPAAAHQAAMAMPMHGHDGHHSGDMAHDTLGDCTMACSATLPATDLPPIALHPIAHPPAEPLLVPRLSGIELEIATPPPRLS